MSVEEVDWVYDRVPSEDDGDKFLIMTLLGEVSVASFHTAERVWEVDIDGFTVIAANGFVAAWAVYTDQMEGICV